MKLQSKVLSIIILIWISMCVIIYLDSRIILSNSYVEVEKRLSIRNIHRVENAIHNSLKGLKLYSIPFSQWDEAYAFMAKKDDRFIRINFVPGTFTIANINFFLYFDNDFKFYYGKAFDLNQNNFVPPPKNLIDYVESRHPNTTGVIKLGDDYLALSVLPVLTSDGDGPQRGWLVMGHYMSEECLEKLSNTVEVATTLIALPPISPTAKQAYEHLIDGNSYYITPKNTNSMYGYSLFKDIRGNNIGLLQINTPRELYAEGIMALFHYLIIVLILGLVILATLWYLFRRLVLARILHVSRQVIAINATGSFNRRIYVGGDDEIKHMASSINSMLELIELTQEQLKYRISKRTLELEKLSELNHNLFNEIGKQKSIELKLREDEKILRRMAYYDTLTGLPNRAFFGELLQKSMIQATFNRMTLAVVFIDCDKFKQINDTYGHDYGDKFLKEVASRLQNTIHTIDVAGRIAGDEFILCLNSITNHQQIHAMVNRIFTALSAPIVIDDIPLSSGFSMGISLYPDDTTNYQDLVKYADLAMYYAKKREGNAYFYYADISSQ